MWFVLIGLVLSLLKLAGLGPTASWSWWAVLSPFVLAVLWWALADASGFTKRKQAEREEARVEKRRRRHLEALGLDPKHPPRAPRSLPPMDQDPSARDKPGR